MLELSRQELKDLFLLAEKLIYLNHGSFGTCPRPVMRAYREWERRTERNAVVFLARELPAHLSGA
ncbi:MAG: hypothetical protein PVI81_00565 [Anaerolineales bacterium]|jgi:isopenicillin-N epimerase